MGEDEGADMGDGASRTVRVWVCGTVRLRVCAAARDSVGVRGALTGSAQSPSGRAMLVSKVNSRSRYVR
jgi:hypothetical protein